MTRQQALSFVIFIWNFFVFLVYGLDKGKAQKGQYRISEKILLGMSLALGGLGALSAGYFFHHKTRKWYFKLAWLVGVVFLLGIFYMIWR
ncbi:DUF1294 domain-containing protein [Streptococcus minor]|uniref:DUF1294 domain-containing protein n=1 Tax=Streptococcus minor TaxID=229549 RepID=A0A3P1VCI3_9STRE|nr:DUF1294 domain-containing protein [Streptococcus minor]RRD31889.1 DUF1294 domain-containing protein [Streptococcus minor]